MTSLELYQKFNLLLNSNSLFQNVNFEVKNFVLLFNREKDRWMAESIKQFGETDRIFDLQSHYISNLKLKEYSLFNNSVLYNLPDNYFAIASCYSDAVKNNKKGKIINHLVKPKDQNEFLSDDFNSPSFEFEESICNITDNKLIVFYKNYLIENTYLSYYKEVGEIDVEGYRKINGELSKTINPDISDFYLEQILDGCVTEVMRQYQNTNGVQLGRDREKINL